MDRELLTVPGRLVEVEACDRALEVTGVGKTVAAERTQVGKLEVGAEDLENVWTAVQPVYPRNMLSPTYNRGKDRQEGRPV